MKRRTLTSEGGTLLAELTRHGVASGEALVAAGAVYIRGRRAVSATQPVAQGVIITVVLEEAGRSVLAPTTALPPLTVVFEDDELIAVAKPAGITSQPTRGDRVRVWQGR